MKLNFNREARNRMLANIAVAVVGISYYFALLHLDAIRGFTGTVLAILRPFVYGFVIAFLLNSPVKYFDKCLCSFLKHNKLRRALSVLLVMVIFAVLISLLMAFLVPQLIDSIVTLVKNVQDFALNLDHYMEIWVNALDKQFHIDPELYQQLLGTWEQILSFSSSLFLSGVQRLLGLTGQVTSGVVDFFVALIISVYLDRKSVV